MGQRSIIEINHDLSHEIDAAEAGAVEAMLLNALASGSDQSWERLKRFGICRIVQVHHSADRKVVISAAGWEKEFPIP
jgi:hypothetical protein